MNSLPLISGFLAVSFMGATLMAEDGKNSDRFMRMMDEAQPQASSTHKIEQPKTPRISPENNALAKPAPQVKQPDFLPKQPSK